MIYVKHGPAGLLVPFEVPSLALDDTIERGWELAGPLMRPKPREFLKTSPFKRPINYPHYPTFSQYWYN